MLNVKFSMQSAQQALTPFADIYESDDKVLIFADMPGVSQDTLEVRVANDKLTIHGRRGGSHQSSPSLVDNLRLIRECPHCDYYRTVELPNTIDAQNIQASIKDGVLTLTLPKKSAKEIDVHQKSLNTFTG